MGKPILLCFAALAACSSSTTTHTAPAQREAPPETVATPRQNATIAEFITGAEIWSPDERDVLGVALAMRESPRGDTTDFDLPDGDFDPGDARALLFGARLIREGDAILSATTSQGSRSFTLIRRAATVWRFDGQNLIGVERLERCDDCPAWTTSAQFIVVVPDGQMYTPNPQVGWSIAISP